MYKTTLCCYKSNGCIILVMYGITSNTIHNNNENVTNNIYLAVVQCKQCFFTKQKRLSQCTPFNFRVSMDLQLNEA